MTAKRWKPRLALLACGAIPLVTNVNCDPARGIFDLYRYDDADYYYDEIIIIDDYDDCFFGFDCF